MYATTVIEIFVLLLATAATVIATTGTFTIPISLNPFIQTPATTLTGIIKTFYESNEFYSKVTITDVENNTEQPLTELIDKKLSVIFYMTLSSYADGTLRLSDLKFTTPSRWSYNVSADNMIKASNGSIASFTQNTQLFRFQEMAMKVLENRYNFSSSTIRSQLGLSMNEYFAANEKQWIDTVGAITDNFIKRQSEKLNLTPCYLAELLNKTLTEVNAFTLYEVDLYLYNKSILVGKLPVFQNTTLTRFYKSFNTTPDEMANSSNVSISVIQSMDLKDLIQLFTKNTLQEFHLSLTDISNKYHKSNMDITFVCPDEWNWFKVVVVREAFENEARNMSLTNSTLSSLIQIPYENVMRFSMQSMLQLIENVVKPVKKDKQMIERKSLRTLTSTYSTAILHDTEDNSFDIIINITNFAKIQLSTLYHWTNIDYQFSELFSVADLVESCSSDVYNYTLLTLANLNVGKTTGKSSCKSLAALRAIWNKATINKLKNMSGSSVNLNSTLEKLLHSVTNASWKFIFRVLNISSEAQGLCSNISLHHLSLVTPHSVSHLMHKSFQDIIYLAHQLKMNGSLYRNPNVIIASSLVSPNISLITKAVQTQLQTLSPSHTNNYTTTIFKNVIMSLPGPPTTNSWINTKNPNVIIASSLVSPNISLITKAVQTQLQTLSPSHTNNYTTTIFKNVIMSLPGPPTTNSWINTKNPNVIIASSLVSPNISLITKAVQIQLQTLSPSHTNNYTATISKNVIMSLPGLPTTNSWINTKNPNVIIASSLVSPNISLITKAVQIQLQTLSPSHTNNYTATISKNVIMSLPGPPTTNSWINTKNLPTTYPEINISTTYSEIFQSHTQKSENGNWSITIMAAKDPTKIKFNNSSEKSYISRVGMLLWILIQTIYQWA